MLLYLEQSLNFWDIIYLGNDRRPQTYSHFFSTASDSLVLASTGVQVTKIIIGKASSTSYVNSTSNYSEGPSTTISTSPITCTSGNTMMVFLSNITSPMVGVSGVADTAGNIYTRTSSVSGTTNQTIEYWMSTITYTSSNDIITATFSGAAQIISMNVVQYTTTSGSYSYDSSSPIIVEDTDSTTHTSSGVVTTVSGDLLVGFFTALDTPAAYHAQAPNKIRNTTAGNHSAVVEHQATTTGTYTVTTTTDVPNKQAIIVHALKLSSGGGSSPMYYIQEDEFSNSSIAGFWTVSGTTGGNFTESGQYLTISGGNNYLGTSGNGPPNWVFQTLSGSFDVVLRLASNTTMNNLYQQPGLAIWQDSTHWARIASYYHSSIAKWVTETYVKFGGQNEAASTWPGIDTLPWRPIYLRMKRNNAALSFYYSLDNENFTSLNPSNGYWTSTAPVSIGPYAMKGNASAYAVRMDWIRNYPAAKSGTWTDKTATSNWTSTPNAVWTTDHYVISNGAAATFNADTWRVGYRPMKVRITFTTDDSVFLEGFADPAASIFAVEPGFPPWSDRFLTSEEAVEIVWTSTNTDFKNMRIGIYNVGTNYCNVYKIEFFEESV